MASQSKKNKCKHTGLDRGGEKGHLFRLKRDAMYHKKDRVANKRSCIEADKAEEVQEPEQEEQEEEEL